MFNSTTKKRIKALGILIILIGTITICLNLNQQNIISNDNLINEEIEDEPNFLDNKNNFPKTADYSPTSNGTGKNLDITLHQSKTDEGTPLFEIISTSDPNNNTINVDRPSDLSFNYITTNISVDGISAPNVYLKLEEDADDADPLGDFTNFIPCASSFEIKGSGILENISVYLEEFWSSQDQVTVVLYNATDDSGTMKPDGSDQYDYTELGKIDVGSSEYGWFNLTGLNEDLDNSKTENNTWFIGLFDNQTSGNARWFFERDSGPGGDGDDASYSVDWNGPVSRWQLIDDSGYNVDFTLKVGLKPKSNNPLPSQIGLQINGSYVTDIAQESGYCNRSDEIMVSSSEVDYEVTAEWWDVSCNITKIVANFTTMDLKASSSFEVLGSGLKITWNVSAGNLNYFDSDFGNYWINFTVPAKWSNFQAFNDTIELTDNTTLGSPQGGYMEYQIYNASNGPNWYITAESQNLLNNISIFVDSLKTYDVNYNETINIIGNFSETIKDGNATVEIYSPDFTGNYLNHTNYNDTITANNEVSLGTWTIKDTAIDYGQFRMQVFWSNDTAASFFEKNLTIWAVTDLNLIDPAVDESYFSNDVFNITVYYNDTGQSLPIENAQMTDNSSVPLTFYSNGTAGFYTTEITVSNLGWNWGWNYIEINASRTYYNNDTTIFSFQKIINTTISPDNIKDFGNVIKGNNVTYVFNYSDTTNDFIEGADIQEVDINPNFDWSWTPIGQGNYSIELDTTNVNASVSKYFCNFSISATGNESQIISLQLKVVMTQTFIDIQSWDHTLIRKDQLNQTVTFYFNDTDNNEVITGLTTDRITVTDSQTGLPRSKWLNTTPTPGLYDLSISTSGLNSGSIRFWITATLPPNYNWSLVYIDFYLRGNLTDIPKISLSDPEGEETLTPIASNYSIFEERDLYVDFNITDTDYNNNLIKSEVDSYLIEYSEIGNSTNQGFLTEDLSFDANTNSFKGDISITELSSLGAYTITIRVTKTNYEEADISFNLIIKARYNVELSIISQPDEVTAGDTFRIIFEAHYNNGTNRLPLMDSDIIITPIFDGITSQEDLTKSTNSTGGLFFEITVARDVRNMSLSIRLEAEYYHVETSLEISDIIINPPPSGGLTFEDLLPYLIIIGAAVAATGGSVAIYRGVIVPKKRKKARILTEVKTIFDDAINLEHVLVLYKGTGTCIYFKSFGSEQIDPELISGFISAISSFGKDLVSQEELNEITYGDKMLLLSDGEYIRVALVLSKKASLILRRNLMEFIHAFERAYTNDLPNWRGQLNLFRDAGSIIDEILSTSIILPHEITYEHSSVKTLKKPQSREVIKIANNLIKDSERNFFFIATLLKEATEKTGKGTAEIFIGIKELRDTKILMPIEISTIEKKPISQQEMNLINQKISTLVNLTPEERQKLVNDLAQVGPAEREAYFASLTEQHEIVSAPIDSKPGTTVIETIKEAKKEIKNLKRIAMVEKKKKDHEKSMKILQNAAKIALSWELVKESQEIDDIMRQTKIEDLYSKMKTLEKEAKLAVKKENYNEAAQKYKISSKIASEIFKLGVTYMTKEVKRLTNKAKEYEKQV